MKMKKSLILGFGVSLLMLASLFMGTGSSNLSNSHEIRNQVLLSSNDNLGAFNDAAASGQVVFFPTSPPELLTRSRTRDFILKSQNVPENNATNIDQIFYRLAAIRVLDPNLGNLTQSLKQFWINQILSFQRSSGGLRPGLLILLLDSKQLTMELYLTLIPCFILKV